jgi:CRISPR-associated protein Csx10
MALNPRLKQMKRLKVTIRLKSPLLITARQVGFVWESETFVPGGVLRGAVAEVAARHEQDLKTLFDRPNAPRFGHAYAGLGPPVGILPQTARTCKRHGGFRRDEEDDERHGVIDTLLAQAFGGAKVEARCPICRQDIDESDEKVPSPPHGQSTMPCGGEPYVAVESSGTWRYVSPHPILRRIGRTAVARERGAAADRLLYTLEVIAEQMERDELDAGRPLLAATEFHGSVWVDGADDWPWDNWLEEATHLGGARSRGLGQVQVKAEEISPVAFTEQEMMRAAMQLTEGKPAVAYGRLLGEMNLLDRILAFNQAVYYTLKCPKEEPHKFWYFTLDLQSDMALGDVRGPRYCPQPADLGLPDLVEKVWGLAGYGQVRGWSAAWGLPKPVTPTLAAGSTFVYSVPRGDEDLTRQVLERCVTLEQNGIGRRCEEGLGWVQICTPFHLKTEVQK